MAAVQHAQQRQQFAASGAAPRSTPGRGTPNSRGRGGTSANRGGRGGRGRGGQDGQQRQDPPRNPMHPSRQEHWNPSAREISLMSRPKPEDNRPTCFYCALGGHGSYYCGHRRPELRENINRAFLPKRGHLISPKKMRKKLINTSTAEADQRQAQFQQQYQAPI